MCIYRKKEKDRMERGGGMYVCIIYGNEFLIFVCICMCVCACVGVFNED